MCVWIYLGQVSSKSSFKSFCDLECLAVIGKLDASFTCLPAGNPSSVMSPASASQSEDQLYMDKLKQLSKYIEPLRRMINKIDKNEGKIWILLKALSSYHCLSSG